MVLHFGRCFVYQTKVKMAFLGIKVNSEVARLFRDLDVPGEKVAENEYHITILCFEENWPVKEVAKAMEATYDVLDKFKPLHIKTSKLTCFPKRPDHPCPIITKVDCKELKTLNESLKKSFDKHDVEYMKTFNDFKPHITLAYADEEIKDEKFEPIEFFAHELILWGGDHGDDRIFVTFPLTACKEKKSSHLVQKANVFQKLSKIPTNGVLKQTKERRKVVR